MTPYVGFDGREAQSSESSCAGAGHHPGAWSSHDRPSGVSLCTTGAGACGRTSCSPRASSRASSSIGHQARSESVHVSTLAWRQQSASIWPLFGVLTRAQRLFSAPHPRVPRPVLREEQRRNLSPRHKGRTPPQRRSGAGAQRRLSPQQPAHAARNDRLLCSPPLLPHAGQSSAGSGELCGQRRTMCGDGLLGAEHMLRCSSNVLRKRA